MTQLRWVWRLTIDVINEYRRDGVGDLAASITFWTLLSIPAAILALVSALGTVQSLVGEDVATDLQTTIDDFLIDTFSDASPLLNTVDDLFNGQQTGVLTFSVLFAFFSLSRGFAGLVRSLDAAYNVEEGRSWWHVRLLAIALGFGTVAVVTVGATAVAIAPSVLFGESSRLFATIVSMPLLFAWALTLFHIGPYHRTPLRYDAPGAALTAVGWLVVTQGFAFYVRLTDTGNSVQTSVGALLLGITLMYALSVIMLVGAELNDVLATRAGVSKRPASIRGRFRHVVRRARPSPNPDPDV